jgi:hypothetical protein
MKEAVTFVVPNGRIALPYLPPWRLMAKWVLDVLRMVHSIWADEEQSRRDRLLVAVTGGFLILCVLYFCS